MRRVSEPVQVVTGAGVDGCDPVSFVWRGRSYAVREVLGRWRERRDWWRALSMPEEVPELEEFVWRVLAGPGRSVSGGIYELGQGREWRLLRIED